MSDTVADGNYAIEAVNASRLLTDSDGLLVAAVSRDAPSAEQTWTLSNLADGSFTLRCVGTSNYLSLGTRQGMYYPIGGEPEAWRIDVVPGRGKALVRATGNRLWLCGLPLDPTPVFLQGVEQDVVPTHWSLSPA